METLAQQVHDPPPEYRCQQFSKDGDKGFLVEHHLGGPNFEFFEKQAVLIDTFAYTDHTGFYVFHLIQRVYEKTISVLLTIGYDLEKNSYRVIGVNWFFGKFNTC